MCKRGGPPPRKRKANMTEANLVVSDQQARQFREEGYFVLERVIPEGHLEALRSECQRFIDERDAEMDRLGVEKLDLDHKGKRYFDAYALGPMLRADSSPQERFRPAILLHVWMDIHS
jgi:hypothetical protein